MGARYAHLDSCAKDQSFKLIVLPNATRSHPRPACTHIPSQGSEIQRLQLRLRIPSRHTGRRRSRHAADRIGSIEPGKLADIVLYDADSINLAGCTDPFKGIVIHATAQDVDLVMVNGTIVKKDGRLLPVATSRGAEEWPKIAARLKTRITGIQKRLAGTDLDARYDTVAKILHYDFADEQ